MNLVGSGLEHYVHGRATAPELRRHGVFFCLEFLDGIGRRQHNRAAQSELVVVDSVQQEVVVGDAQPVDGDGFIRAFVFKHASADV